MKKPLLHRPTTLCLFGINGILLLFGAALVILGIYAIIDNADMSELLGTSLYTSGIYMLIFFGIIVLALAALGFASSYHTNRCISLIYIVILCITILFLFISGIIVLAFRDSLGESAKTIMASTIKNQYGRYKIITEAWNATQTLLRCCGVENLGWQVYTDSWWDTFVNTDVYFNTAKLPRTNPYYKFVPESCCATIIDGITGWPTSKYRDLRRCQTWQYGPPSFTDGPHNDALYYAGCFESLKSYLNQYGKSMGALAFIALVILIVALVLSVMQLIELKQYKPIRENGSEHLYVNDTNRYTY